MGLTFICGPRDSGKTRTAAGMAERLRAEGRTVGGVLSIATMRDGVKQGYALRDLAGGEARPYAVRRPGPVPPGGLAFEFLEPGMEFGREAVRRGLAAGVDALFVDEAGPLELCGGGLWQPLAEARASHRGELVVTVRPSLLEALTARLGVLPGEARVIRLEDPRRAQVCQSRT
jgi:nucleoside-triphosphatase THEP1